jgi:hypothetical protein
MNYHAYRKGRTDLICPIHVVVEGEDVTFRNTAGSLERVSLQSSGLAWRQYRSTKRATVNHATFIAWHD